MQLSSTIGRLRLTGFLEGMSFLVLLLIAMPLKYIADMPGMVRVVGMAHGILFILYIALSFFAKFRCPWPWRTVFLLWVASVIPFGTFYADYKILRYER